MSPPKIRLCENQLKSFTYTSTHTHSFTYTSTHTHSTRTELFFHKECLSHFGGLKLQVTSAKEPSRKKIVWKINWNLSYARARTYSTRLELFCVKVLALISEPTNRVTTLRRKYLQCCFWRICDQVNRITRWFNLQLNDSEVSSWHKNNWVGDWLLRKKMFLGKLNYILSAFNLPSEEQLLAALGYGHITADAFIQVCCSVLQYVAVCCSMLQCVAVCCSVL